MTHRTSPWKAASVADLAAESPIRDALQWFSAEKKWITEKHLELTRIAAPTFQEQRRAEWMAAQFRAIGCDARLDRAGNVVAFPAEPGEGGMVALTAHLDTVIEPRSPEDIQFGRDGKLYGPGVSDNGAGLAALLAIAQAIRNTPALLDAPLPLVLVANVGEEGEGNLSGMRFLCRPSGLGTRIASWVVLDGPSLDHITTRALASRRFEITVTGPGGHSWSDYGVANPVHAISRAVALFSEHQPVNGSSPRSSFNFGLIEGGTSVNSIPTTARAKLDIRSESATRIEELASLLTASLERAMEVENDRSPSGRVTAKLREIGSRPGGQLAEGAPILSHIRSVDAYLGVRTHIDCASTDANIPLSLGMQALSIGAGGQGGGAHTPSEWYHPEGRETGLRRVLFLLCLLMRDLDPAAARVLPEFEMTAADFRRIALSLEGAEEGSHMGAVDFRVGGRIFATLASVKQGYGNLMITPEVQAEFIAEQPDVFVPIAGGWGRMGMTHIVLAAANEDLLAGALLTAWRLRVEKNAAGSGKKRVTRKKTAP